MGSSFRIIPVLDLKGGAVVRARAGERETYRPIATPLAKDSTPESVLAGLLSLAPFRTIYVADLDAIAGTGGHGDVVLRLSEQHPGFDIWLDAGFASAESAQAMARPGIVPVLGSESLESGFSLVEAVASLGRGSFILSLDYRAGRFCGAGEIERQPQNWPDRLILMTLDRVGMKAGPDFAALAALAARADGRALFAAGGVRDVADLERLAAAGVRGVLVATALHDGRLTRETLSRFV